MEDEIRQRFEEIEKRMDKLEGKLVQEGKKSGEGKPDSKLWYKPAGTVAKLVGLVGEGFFSEPKTLSEVSVAFAAKDYHYKLSDLTLPVRQLVRHGVLRREKKNSKWAYGKI